MRDDSFGESGPEQPSAVLCPCPSGAEASPVWPGIWWGIHAFGDAPRADRNTRGSERSGGGPHRGQSYQTKPISLGWAGPGASRQCWQCRCSGTRSGQTKPIPSRADRAVGGVKRAKQSVRQAKLAPSSRLESCPAKGSRPAGIEVGVSGGNEWCEALRIAKGQPQRK